MKIFLLFLAVLHARYVGSDGDQETALEDQRRRHHGSTQRTTQRPTTHRKWSWIIG